MGFEYYKSLLKPYYLDNIQYDEDGNIVRSQSPNQILDKFNPLPSQDIQQKINFYFMPYNQLQHTEKYMIFDDKESQRPIDHNPQVNDLIQAIKHDSMRSELCQTSCTWRHFYNFICRTDTFSDIKS